MPKSVIRLEIDPEDYERVKKQITDLYELTDKASFKIRIAAQQKTHWMIYMVLGLDIFVLGSIFGFWLAGI